MIIETNLDIKAIISRRRAMKITQSELAAHIGINPRTYQRVETGKSGLKLCDIMKIAEILEMNVKLIYDDKGKARKKTNKGR